MPGTSWGLYTRTCKLFIHVFSQGTKTVILQCSLISHIVHLHVYCLKVEGSGFAQQLRFLSTWMIGMQVATTLRSLTFQSTRLLVVLLDECLGFGSNIEFQFRIEAGCSLVFPVTDAQVHPENRAKIVSNYKSYLSLDENKLHFKAD